MPIDVKALPHTKHAHEFIGGDHGDVPFSLIFIHAPPGAGPELHQHPYPEVFVVEDGEARFVVGDETFTARTGQIVVGPAEVAHGFTNSGHGDLRLTAIHGAPRFVTNWVNVTSSVWSSRKGSAARP
jgi:mannose-6-phosphate isomerase-like protein (cupin superfamily)